jgi:AAA+ ATPase superfamily predicted ATPase
VLHEEPERVLRDEEAAALERATCELIGRGARRPSELAARLGVKETTLSKPLRHLTDLSLVVREAPYDLRAGRAVEGGRRAFYKLSDPFLAMWYACVRPNLSGLNLGATAARARALGAWSRHVAAVWEDLCRAQWHGMRHRAIEWEPAGRYWSGREPGGEEWDVVSVAADRRHVFLGECKWVRNPTPAKLDRIIREVRRRARLAPAGVPERATIHLGLFVPEATKLPRTIDGVELLDASRVLDTGR